MRVLLTRVATGAVAAAVSLGFLIGTAGPAAAAGCTIKFGTYSTVKAGTTGSKARSVECLLNRGGYATSQNSSFSKADAAALKAFQTKHGLPGSGKTTGATWAALVAQGATPTLEPGDTGADVQRLQLALRALGHDELPGTTLYGSLTESAVSAFQKKIGVKATGRAGHKVWAALQAGGTAGSAGSSSSSSKTKGEVALAFARKQLGDKYKYGAAGPDRWDCSGLTMKAWAAAGVKLPHNSAAQYKIGKKVAKKDLRPGDLVFFYSGPSHVGLYVGDGKIIHAPSSGKKVSYIKISYMPWKGARRPG